MGTSWAELTDDPIGSQNDDNSIRERDSEKWRLPSTETDLQNFAIMTGTPEDLRMLPQDMKLLPQEVNADSDEWTLEADPT